jgi:hypothetical protein
MSDDTKSSKVKKGPKTLDEEIAAAEERVRRLKAAKAEQERKSLEKNQKLIYAFLRTEKLDAVPIETWSSVVPQLRKLLKAAVSADDRAASSAGDRKNAKGAVESPVGSSSGSSTSELPGLDVPAGASNQVAEAA